MSRAGQTLERLGRDVTLSNYESTGEDDYGENWAATADSPHTVKARVDRSRQFVPDADASGVGVEADIVVYIEAGTTAADNVRDGIGEGSTQVTVDGQDHRVAVADDQDNGFLALHCRRER